MGKIKALWVALKLFGTIKKEATKMSETTAGIKPGYKTTEFWLTVLTNLLTITQALQGVIPVEKAAIIVAAINGVYGVVRAIAKKA